MTKRTRFLAIVGAAIAVIGFSPAARTPGDFARFQLGRLCEQIALWAKVHFIMFTQYDRLRKLDRI